MTKKPEPPKRIRPRPWAVTIEFNAWEHAKLQRLVEQRQRTTAARVGLSSIIRDLVRDAKETP